MIFLLLTYFAIAVTAHVIVLHPIQDQLPLIARVNSTYTWSLSSNTFASTDGAALAYTTTPLPPWLTFHPDNLEFRGIPDEDGAIDVTVTARNGQYAAASSWTLITVSTPPPSVALSIASQFSASSPSISSVFPISFGSALSTPNPSLRIPPDWSFSVGFHWDTVTSSSKIFYGALQADGSPIPSWIRFNPNTVTLNGVTPTIREAPSLLSLVLHASEHDGYSSVILPFDLVIAAHELSMPMSSLPTINVTAGAPFNLSLTSSADFMGVSLDGKAIDSFNISDLSIDASSYGSWLQYDRGSRTLSGSPAQSTETILLPVSIIAANQTLHTNVSLAQVASFFSTSSIPPILGEPAGLVNFDLKPFYAHGSTLTAADGSVNLTAAFDPDVYSDYLAFDPVAGVLAGRLPDGDPSHPRVTVTFAAYSYLTHSISHTSLNISLTGSAYKDDQDAHREDASNRHVELGLEVAGAILGGMVLFAILLAAFRRYAKLDDPVVGGQEGRKGYSLDEKRWYGMEEGNSFDKNSLMDNPVTPVQPTPSVYPLRDPGLYGTLTSGVRGIVAADKNDQ
ncbi:hypothetical protein PUNSTDRAFT_133182 [Punctularia strigosozonata HHB-11173 SS5]|uniref:uncharacterized protein n=1 Tax=Punctularia strigosozonata (strain HHB-11173) TaxID=741275 RepID=UPI0004416786|nr:uncharacterized protein PUNSTDRAFT_133182 [Punctularia strigosozonata HHB-11173 SS5]EIN09386.1 hypothetical protein PUNSTDRAFT_133182 [Punctularia strigosozonata HHB-11173 SS5]